MMNAVQKKPVIDVVAVDGPGGTGKGTLCQSLAERLGWHLLDSGALYRVLALAAEKHGLALDDESALAHLAADLDVAFKSGDAGVEVLLEGADVTDEIRTENCGNAASKVAALHEVRQALLGRQRDFRRSPGLVADGRDMGTVVFPDALLKVFLTASQEERAKRRHNQLKLKGISVSLPHLLKDIAERDERDRQRSASPLRCAPDAIEIDTTGMSIDAVLMKVMDLVHGRMR